MKSNSCDIELEYLDKQTLKFRISLGKVWLGNFEILVAYFQITVFEMQSNEPVYNNQLWDPKIVAVVDKWLLLSGHLCI